MADDKDEKPKLEPDYGQGFFRVHYSLGRMLVNNLVGGIFWGFGTVLGATIFVALVLFILGRLDTVPIIGDFIARILEQIELRQTVQ
jgi:hypothetical protein